MGCGIFKSLIWKRAIKYRERGEELSALYHRKTITQREMRELVQEHIVNKRYFLNRDGKIPQVDYIKGVVPDILDLYPAKKTKFLVYFVEE